MNLSVAEVLKKAGTFKDVAARAKYLKDNDTKALKAVVYFTYAKEVKWLIPDSDPPYRPTTPEQDLQNVLKSTYNRLRIYVEGGGYPDMSKTKREMNFIEWLESMDPDDAKLILAIRKGEIPYPGMSRHVAKKAFPDIAKAFR
jgi:hypothetical protein|tara:strand:- start:81 stop:509 length:429 start_codon:yes stop_codon:yes gene_type:complete